MHISCLRSAVQRKCMWRMLSYVRIWMRRLGRASRNGVRVSTDNVLAALTSHSWSAVKRRQACWTLTLTSTWSHLYSHCYCVWQLNMPVLLWHTCACFLFIKCHGLCAFVLRNLLKMFNEIHYWDRLLFEIPHYVTDVYQRREELHNLKENVLLVVKDYNRSVIFSETFSFTHMQTNPKLWGTLPLLL